MPRILLPFLAALAACTPSPQDAAMRSAGQLSEIVAEHSSEHLSEAGPRQGPAIPDVSGQAAGVDGQAAQGPSPEAVSAAENPLPAAAPTQPKDSPEEARGRRTLSTAFVRVGADGHLTVELRDGRVLVLRNVVMRPEDYCGAQVLGGSGKARYCGRYADVAAARPGGEPASGETGPAMASPIGSEREPSDRR